MHTAVFAQSIQLFPDGTIFFHIALILLMIWVLNRTFFRPINKVISNREKFRNVEGGEAGSIAREADEKEAAYNRELLDARSASYAYLEDQHAKLVKAREKKLTETRSETEQKTAAERLDIERQAADARAAIGADAAKLADEIAATVLKG
jgi:F-type H+-transporting ATPase subunit b